MCSAGNICDKVQLLGSGRCSQLRPIDPSLIRGCFSSCQIRCFLTRYAPLLHRFPHTCLISYKSPVIMRFLIILYKSAVRRKSDLNVRNIHGDAHRLCDASGVWRPCWSSEVSKVSPGSRRLNPQVRVNNKSVEKLRTWQPSP